METRLDTRNMAWGMGKDDPWERRSRGKGLPLPARKSVSMLVPFSRLMTVTFCRCHAVGEVAQFFQRSVAQYSQPWMLYVEPSQKRSRAWIRGRSMKMLRYSTLLGSMQWYLPYVPMPSQPA